MDLSGTPVAFVNNKLLSQRCGQQKQKQSLSHQQTLFGRNRPGSDPVLTARPSCANLTVR